MPDQPHKQRTCHRNTYQIKGFHNYIPSLKSLIRVRINRIMIVLNAANAPNIIPPAKINMIMSAIVFVVSIFFSFHLIFMGFTVTGSRE